MPAAAAHALSPTVHPRVITYPAQTVPVLKSTAALQESQENPPWLTSIQTARTMLLDALLDI